MRNKIKFAILSLFPFISAPAETYDELYKTSIKITQQANAKLETIYKLSTYENYFYDQDDGSIVFKNGDEVKLKFKIVISGSISNASKTWLWSWGNKTIIDSMSQPILFVKRYGVRNNYNKLFLAKWDAEEVDGWEMASISNKLLNGIGVYRVPDEDGFLFMVLTKVVSFIP